MSKTRAGTIAINVPPMTVHFGRDSRMGKNWGNVPPISPATPDQEWISALFDGRWSDYLPIGKIRAAARMAEWCMTT